MNPSADNLRFSSPASLAIEEFIGSDHHVLLIALRDVAASYSLPVYLVGGPVRDLLLGLPIRDLDFVMESDATAIAHALAQEVNGRVVVHSRFGTATVTLEDSRIDLVTARKEVYPVPGSLPVVEPSSLYDDLARRDFTINAIALPLDGNLENLVDPFHGKADLANRVVRTIHARSFNDDPTRLFRAVRYQQRLGFTFEEETLAQFNAAVESRSCDTVSGDRLRHELELMVMEGHPERVLGRASDMGLLSSLVPGLGQREYLARWAASSPSKDNGDAEPWLPWLAALAYPLSAADGEALIRRLNMPRAWARVVRDSIELRDLQAVLTKSELPLSELSRLLQGISVATLKVVREITDSAGTAKNLDKYLEAGRDLAPVLKGDDLLDMGVPPGPLVGQMLTRLRELRLDRLVNSEDEERRWVREMVASLGSPAGCK